MSVWLQLNKPIEFGAGQPSVDALVSGWSHPEAGFVWTDGPQASLSLSVDRLPQNSRLIINATPYLSEGDSHQSVFVYGNGLLMRYARLDSAGVLDVLIPPYMANNVLVVGGLSLTLALPDCKKPPDRKDARKLGIALHRIELRTRL